MGLVSAGRLGQIALPYATVRAGRTYRALAKRQGRQLRELRRSGASIDRGLSQKHPETAKERELPARAKMANMMAPGGFATTKVCRHDDCADERCRRMEAHDALLDPCCAKDQKERRQASKWMAQLRAADPARKALDARRGAVDVAPLPEYERPPRPYPAAPAKKQLSSDEEDSDSDAEFLDELENDNELMEKMRSARIRENECMRETTSSELATALTRGPVLVHAFSTSENLQHLDGALAVCCSERGVRFLRTRRGQAIGEKELIDARLTREKISEGKGALLAFVGGVVTACALDLNEFADADAVAHDRVERWLDNARCASGEADDDEVVSEAEEPVIEYYDCGKPGCCKTFEHKHVGLEMGAPREFDVDHERV